MKKVLIAVFALPLVSCGSSENEEKEAQINLISSSSSSSSSSIDEKEGDANDSLLMLSYGKSDKNEVTVLMKDIGCYKASLVREYNNIAEYKIEKNELCEKESYFVYFNSKNIPVILNPVYNKDYSSSQICNLENMTYTFYHEGFLDNNGLAWLDALGQVFPHYKHDADISDNGKDRFYQGDAQFCGNHVNKIHANFYNFAEHKKGN